MGKKLVVGSNPRDHDPQETKTSKARDQGQPMSKQSHVGPTLAIETEYKIPPPYLSFQIHSGASLFFLALSSDELYPK